MEFATGKAVRWPYFTLRQKVLLGAVLPVVLFAVIGVVSYSSLTGLEATLTGIEAVDDLANTILEIRRYEKNVLLYRNPSDYAETMVYLDEAQRQVEDYRHAEAPQSARTILAGVADSLGRYRQILAALRGDLTRPDDDPTRRDTEALRLAGKDLVDHFTALKTSERDRLSRLVDALKRQLAVAGILVVASGLALTVLISRKILMALAAITKATTAIAQGRFEPLPVPVTHDETQHVLEAFNHMTRELERRQEQLVREKKLSSLGVLTSGIAHQLNNPLNNISTSCQILLEEDDQCDREFAGRMLTNIDQEVHRARDIVKGLLEFSRARDFALKPSSLSQVLERASKLVSSQIPAGVELSRDVPDNLVLEMDSVRLQEAFINLLLNAAQAIETGPGAIRVKAWKDEKTQEAVVTVEDTGMGIADEDLGKVFDPFYTTKEVGKGTGLGLSIVFGIIEKHKGSIAAEKTEGRGARFVIRLPLVQPGQDLS
ncbi:ATP-binding protein [Fundidesulfovibrio butyratiphilus]